MLQKLRGNSQGFTLIELMIVIAIIGILAAIAIPNFIAYRNKAFCTRAEADAGGIEAAIADYFSVPDWVNTPTLGQLNNGKGYTLSGTNTGTVSGANSSINITIEVIDTSSRCPTEYQAANAGDETADPKESGWDSTSSYGTYKYWKYMNP